MFIISYKLPYEKLDSTIELLAINDIYNVFYEFRHNLSFFDIFTCIFLTKC